ncbi:MAG: carbohydrate ABC transporter permease [Hungatella hathewayi]|nr:carbohydrate ABC transporter permease [Hungatella hathewayi]
MKTTTWKKIAVYGILCILTVLAVYPLIWMFLSSFKTNGEFLINRFGFPRNFTLENYKNAWTKANFPAYFVNSGFTAIISLLIMLGLASMTAFAFTRYRVTCAGKLLMYFMIGQMLSAQVVLIAVYLVAITFHMVDSLLGLALFYAASGLPFTIFLLYGFFQTVPQELYEAAEIDGYHDFKIFSRIALPLVKPGLATALIIQFMYVWNEFSLSLIVISSPEKNTLPVGIYRVVNDMYYSSHTLACAGLAITAVPVILVYAVFQKEFIEGMAAGAVKG